MTQTAQPKHIDQMTHREWREHFKLQGDVIRRARALGLTQGAILTPMIDIDHAFKAFNLDMVAWLATDDGNFAHDFVGIQNNIDRGTGEFLNCFVPRFSRPLL